VEPPEMDFKGSDTRAVLKRKGELQKGLKKKKKKKKNPGKKAVPKSSSSLINKGIEGSGGRRVRK